MRALVSTLPIVLAVALGTGCTEAVPEPDSEPSGVPITFAAADWAASRGQATTAANLHRFAVSATVYSDDGDRTLYFSHEEYSVTRPLQDVYRTVTGNVHYWRAPDDEYNFYAYTPSPYIYFAPGVVDKFIYSTPKDVVAQPDIVVATCIGAQYGKTVSLNFTHPLCQVSLYEGPTVRLGRIKSVAFSGIIDHGEYNMLTGEWLMQTADTDTFVWLCDVATSPDTDLSGVYHNFFFVPQRLGANAALTVTFVDVAGVTEVHRVPLSGTWLAGHHYRYSISIM